MSYMQTKALSQAFKVKKLYKESLRQLQAYYCYRHTFRYQAVLMRARFDEYKNVTDPIQANQILEDGQAELWKKRHPQPFKFPDSPGGVAYGREAKVPDWYFDVWHPLERAQYPEYFTKREQRKKEFIEDWEKQYGKPDAQAH